VNAGFWSALESRAGPAGVAEVDAVLEAFELMTVDEAGWPHVAWLGPAEVVVIPARRLALALWPGSSTRANLGRHGRAVLQLVSEPLVYRARLDVEEVGPIVLEAGELAGFVADVVDVVEDAVGYATVSSGPTYRLVGADAVTERWRQQVEGLLEAVAGSAGPPGSAGSH
jgi:hypothetical protein